MKTITIKDEDLGVKISNIEGFTMECHVTPIITKKLDDFIANFKDISTELYSSMALKIPYIITHKAKVSIVGDWSLRVVDGHINIEFENWKDKR